MRLKTRNGLRPCGICAKEYPATAEHFSVRKSRSLRSECRPCLRQRSSTNQKARHHAGGVNYHIGYLARGARLRARKFNVAYTIDAGFLAALLEKQAGLCAVTGVRLTFAKGVVHVPTNASIDRIDPKQGYTPDNVQLVANQVNTMKSNLSLGDFVAWCRLVLEGSNGLGEFAIASTTPTQADGGSSRST